MSPVARAWLPAALYMALIWGVSSLSDIPSTEYVPFQDKGVHFLEYALLGALVLHGVRGSLREERRVVSGTLAVSAAVLFGLLDEIHQAFVPGRSSDPRDLVADALGAVAGALVYALSRP